MRYKGEHNIDFLIDIGFILIRWWWTAVFPVDIYAAGIYIFKFCVWYVNCIQNTWQSSNFIYEFLVLCLQFWKSLKVVVFVEPEISGLVLILYLVCKLYPGHVTVMMMSSGIFCVMRTILAKFKICSTRRNQVCCSFCIWSVYCIQVTWQSWRRHLGNSFFVPATCILVLT